MRCFQTVLIALFATLQAKGAESESELMDAFAQCRGSLTNLRSLNDSDRGAISASEHGLTPPMTSVPRGSAATLVVSLDRRRHLRRGASSDSTGLAGFARSNSRKWSAGDWLHQLAGQRWHARGNGPPRSTSFASGSIPRVSGNGFGSGCRSSTRD